MVFFLIKLIKMIDSHCHLDREPILSNLNDILVRSRKIGLKKLLTICTNDNNYNTILSLVNKEGMIYGTYGIHPHETDVFVVSKNHIIKKFKENDKIIGVGETGLDFYYNNSKKNLQIDSFKNHLEASIELNVPLIIHSRNAEKETFDILNKYKLSNPKILMHCFTGSLKFAHKLIELNAYFSASGIITFKKSEDLRNTFKIIPKEKLLIETDSPFLTPEPLRGKNNEPSYIINTLNVLSNTLNLSTDYLSSLTTNNFNELFSK